MGAHDRRGRPSAIDMAQVHARKDKIVKGLTGGIELLFKKNKIDWIKGSGRLAGKGGVEITEGQKQTLAARKEIIVATGSTPRSVPGIEIDRKRIITSDEAIHLKEIPKSIAILGSGAVGVEFASIFRRFGSDVTIIELLPRIVPVEDEAVSAELEKSFKKQGIKVLTGTKVTSAKPAPGAASISRRRPPTGRAPSSLPSTCSSPPAAVPVTSGLGAEEAGLQLDRGYIKVDKEFKTGVPGISAIGDVITFDKPGHPQLAHLSSAEGIVLAERIAGKEYRPINYDQVPGCTYCDPEIGSVGLTEKQAQERGYDVKTGVVQVRNSCPRAHRRRDRGLRQDRLRQEVRRGAGRPHDRPALDRARRRSDARPASRVHGRGARAHHPRASDDVGGGWGGGARRARRGDTCVMTRSRPDLQVGTSTNKLVR